MRVAAIQMQSVPNDTSRNVKRAQQLLQEAAARGVDLAVLPESRSRVFSSRAAGYLFRVCGAPYWSVAIGHSVNGP